MTGQSHLGRWLRGSDLPAGADDTGARLMPRLRQPLEMALPGPIRRRAAQPSGRASPSPITGSIASSDAAPWPRCIAPEVKIPRKNYVATLKPHFKPGLKDEAGAIKEALEKPIGTKRLKEIAKGRKNAVIVVNDITRPTAT